MTIWGRRSQSPFGRADHPRLRLERQTTSPRYWAANNMPMRGSRRKNAWRIIVLLGWFGGLAIVLLVLVRARLDLIVAVVVSIAAPWSR